MKVALGMGSEPKIISTMASKSSIQSPNHVSLIGNPDAEKFYYELLSQHKARKIDDPVIVVVIVLGKKQFRMYLIIHVFLSANL